MAASNAQVQAMVDTRVRPSCTDILLWFLRRSADKANFDDIYANLTSGSPWTDSPDSGVPHVALASDILAWNTFMSNLLTIIGGSIGSDSATALSLIQGIQGQWAIIQKLPVTEVIPE